jgi:hypothetical protein
LEPALCCAGLEGFAVLADLAHAAPGEDASMMRNILLGGLSLLLLGGNIVSAQTGPSASSWNPSAVSQVCHDQNPHALPAHPQYPTHAWSMAQPGCCLPPPCDDYACAPKRLPCVWVTGEYLYWKVKEGPLGVPLVTTGEPQAAVIIRPPTPQGRLPGQVLINDDPPGGLGQPDTQVLFGNDPLDYDWRSGFRINAGVRLSCDGKVGLEGSGFWLDKETITFSTSSDAAGNPVIARPVRDAITGNELVFTVAAPGQFAGAIDIDSTSELWGAEFNFSYQLCHRKCFALDLLMGLRYLRLDEDLNINTSQTVLAGGTGFAFGPVIAQTGDVLTVRDSFDCENEFTGGQLGLRMNVSLGKFFVFAKTKVALGRNEETLTVDGSSSLAGGGITTTLPGGLLALSSNIRSEERSEFTIVPEASVAVGMDITCWWRVYAGYNFLYVSNVIRPGDQLDRVVNPNLVPVSQTFGQAGGPQRPAQLFVDNDFWAHGLFAGMGFRF